NAASGSVAYARMRRIDYRAGILFAAAAVPGAVLGSLTTQFIRRTTFDLLFGAVMVIAGAYLLFNPAGSATSPGGSLLPTDRPRYHLGLDPGAQVGARLSNRVPGSRIIRGLGVVLLGVGIHLFRQALR